MRELKALIRLRDGTGALRRAAVEAGASFEALAESMMGHCHYCGVKLAPLNIAAHVMAAEAPGRHARLCPARPRRRRRSKGARRHVRRQKQRGILGRA